MTETKSKILMVDPTGSGGICHYVYGLCDALRDQPVDLQVLTTTEYELDFLQPQFRMQRSLPSHAVQARRWSKGFRYLKTLRAIRRAALAFQPDIVHLQVVKLPWLERQMVTALQKTGIRCVLTMHDLFPREATRPSRAYRRFYHALNGVILHAEENAHRFQSLFHPPASLAQAIIPHGDYEFLANPIAQTEARRAVGVPAGKKVLLFFGYIRKYKGLDVLLHAMRTIVARVPETLLLVAGKPVDTITEYTAMTASAGLSAHVRFDTSYIPLEHVGAYFSAADLVVLPYRNIDQSGVGYMASAHARPLVVTDAGGLPTLVEAGVNGRVVPRDNPEALAEAIVDLLTHADLPAMGAAGKKLVHARYGWSGIAQKHAAFYRQVLR